MDTRQEDRLHIGRAWPYRVLGEEETHVTSTALQAIGLLPNLGQRALLQVRLEDYLQVVIPSSSSSSSGHPFSSPSLFVSSHVSSSFCRPAPAYSCFFSWVCIFVCAFVCMCPVLVSVCAYVHARVCVPVLPPLLHPQGQGANANNLFSQSFVDSVLVANGISLNQNLTFNITNSAFFSLCCFCYPLS